MRCCTGSGGDSETKNGVKGMNEQSEPWKALPELPADVVAYSRTPDFTPETLPEAFKAAHTTKSGVWGVIHVLDGCLSYHLEPPHEGSKLVSAGETALIPRDIPHRVAFVEGGCFFVEFFKKPNP
jgi:tellurite methyltransferase